MTNGQYGQSLEERTRALFEDLAKFQAEFFSENRRPRRRHRRRNRRKSRRR